MVLGNLSGGKLIPGSDAQDVRFFPLNLIPKEMAFPTDLLVVEKLKHFMKSGKNRWFFEPKNPGIHWNSLERNILDIKYKQFFRYQVV
jgi:hypothetical protein